MGRAGNLEGKVEEDEDLEERKPVTLASIGDEADDEANEDLSLKIAENSLLMRAAKLAENNYQDVDSVHDDVHNNDNDSCVLGVCRGGNGTVEEDGMPLSQDAEALPNKKRKKKIKDASSEEEDKAGTQENADPTFVQTTDNMVLRKLLRGRRYFDPPASGLLSCYNCGEYGHMAVKCPPFQTKKKPCFICGSLEHRYKQCSKERVCPICKTAGHHPKKCREKHKGGPLMSRVCLKCGDSGHDMFSCGNSCTVDDLKEIQCYICKSFGHLCCVDICNTSPKEVSCYKCGELGHTGLECSSLREEAKASLNTSCSMKAGKSDNEFSAPELGKHRGRITETEERGYMTLQKPKQRGGWIMDDAEDVSPSTPYDMDHKDFNFMPDGQSSGSQSSKGYMHMSNSHSGKRKRVKRKVKRRKGWPYGRTLDYHHSRFNNWGNAVSR